MRDDRIQNPRLRLCPFCGSAGRPELKRSGAAAFAHCNVCRADGPMIVIDEYLRDDFHEMSPADQDTEWHDATIAAMNNAMMAWNRRPWEASMFEDELEKLDQKMEQEAY